MRELLLTATAALAAAAFGQTTQPPPAPDVRYMGAVAKVESGSRALLVQLDGGGEKWIGVPQALEALRVAPGERDIAKAVRIAFEEVRAGDRVLVRSASVTSDVVIATQLVVISQADLLRQQHAERADWKARGISGKVTALRAETGEVTITTNPRPVAEVIVVIVTGKTEQRRYRADSARFSDARPAALTDIRVGDQLQALGNRSGDGTILTADKIVSGLFRNFAATVEAVNPAQQEFTVEPAEGGPPLVVKIGPASILRKLRPDDASALTARKSAKQGDKGIASSDPQTILESSHAVTLAELKPGDAVIIATGATGTQAGARIPVIALIAGAEPLFKRSREAQRELLGSWNLSLDPEPSGERGGSK